MSPITERPAPGLGAALTPEDWARYIIEGLTHQSVLLASGASRIVTALKAVHVPRVVDDGASWYDELEVITESGPTGDDLVLTPKKCAALATLSNESVNDSDPAAIDVVGQSMVRAVALEADKAMFAGTGTKQPLGIFGQVTAKAIGAVDYTNVVKAAGLVRAQGGVPNAVYVNPADYTDLQLQTDSNNRPLIQPDPTQGPAATIAGLVVWPTPAIAADTALVAQADQVVVAIREDATVEVSGDAAFEKDATLARVIARVDVGLNDLDGLAKIAAT
jgi:HK97 family phage major capsid protein